MSCLNGWPDQAPEGPCYWITVDEGPRHPVRDVLLVRFPYVVWYGRPYPWCDLLGATATLRGARRKILRHRRSEERSPGYPRLFHSEPA